MSLTLDEWIIYLLLEGVTSCRSGSSWATPGRPGEAVCAGFPDRTKVMAAYTYQEHHRPAAGSTRC